MNDAAFNALFRSKETRGVVASFLSEVTGISREKFVKAQYVGGELTKKMIIEKGKVADVIIHLKHNQIIIVEANNFKTNTILQKNFSYATSIYIESIGINDRLYPNIILININRFNRHHVEDPIQKFELY